MAAKQERMEPYEPELQRQWRKDVGAPVRYPRTGYDHVVELVNSAWPPVVFMREHLKTTDIVIRLAASSRQLTDIHRKMYFEKCGPLRHIFDNVISKPSLKKENTIRWKLATEAYRAYQMTWLHLFRVQLLNQFDPRSNSPEWYSAMEKTFKSRRPSGRPKKDNDDQLRNRFELLLDLVTRLRRRIAEHQAKKSFEAEGDRIYILRALWREILKIPGGGSILGGEAFLKIPYGKRNEPAKLEDPTSWKPRQLAVALLAFELGQAYQTIERKFPFRKKAQR
jgi:hypothetical protein